MSKSVTPIQADKPWPWWTRATVVGKPGVGTVAFASARWRPRRVVAAWLRPDVPGAGWSPVALDVLDRVLAAPTWEQAMADLRR